MCLICMKYRIILLIIIIISLGKISLSYIANTSCTHACMHARTRTHAHTRKHAHPTPTPTPTHDRRCSLYRCAQSVRHGWAHRFRRWRDNGRSVIHCQLFVYSSVSLDRYQIEHYFVDHSNSCLMSLLTIIYCHQPRYLKISTTSICSSFTVTPASDCIFSTFRIPEGWYFHM